MDKKTTEHKKDDKQTQFTTNMHVIKLMEQAFKKVQQIKEEAKEKLRKIQAKLELTEKDTPYAKKLKSEEIHYSKALNDANSIEKSMEEKYSAVKSSSTSEKNTLTDIIIDVKLPKPKEKKEEKIDAQLIQKLRGLTPGQNLFLRDQTAQVLQIIKTDISYANLNDKQKINKLRHGRSAYYMDKPKNKTNTNVQIHTQQKRENQRPIPHSRVNKRGSRTRA